MGLRQHSAALLDAPSPLHPRMPLVVRGFGDLSVVVSRVSLLKRAVATVCEGMVLLGWENDRYMLVRPPKEGWPEGEIEVTPRAYGDSFGGPRLVVGDDEPVASPTFAFTELRLARPVPPPVSPLLGSQRPPFYVPGPTVTQTGLGLVTSTCPMVELTVALSNGHRLGGWTLSGSHAVADYEPPVEGVTLVGAIVRDMLGQETVYGDVSPRKHS